MLGCSFVSSIRCSSSCSSLLGVIMDSSPVLRQQSHNKMHRDIMRAKNEQNKMPAHPKPSKLLSAPHLSKQNIENQVPGPSEIGGKAPVRPGVSRLPVLARSLHLPTPSDFSQSHSRWEAKPLAGKTKKKKPCTRPVPFNLSQPKISRVATENHPTLSVSKSRTGTHAVQPDKNVCNARLKTPKPQPALLNRGVEPSKGTSNGKAEENPYIQTSGHSWPTPSAVSSNTLSSIPNNNMHQTSVASSAPPASSAEACLDTMSLLSLKDPVRTLHACQNVQPTTEGDKGENFQSDHAALLSVLRNEGVRATDVGSATPQSNAYNYLPQRVSVMKSRQKAGSTTGLIKSMQFSPDPAALQSILQNEGVKGGGPVGATPRNSTCPSGRGTSIYTAQRVPLKKNRAEATGGAAAIAVKETPLKTWTPRRIRDTRHQPMSAPKWLPSTQQSPYAATPGLRSGKANIRPHQEEIVQRLFDDQEDEQTPNVTEKDPETQAEPIPAQVTITRSHCAEKLEVCGVAGIEVQEDQRRLVGGQTFFQAPHRESVIFFSTGKTLSKAPIFEKQESSARRKQHDPALPGHKEVPPESVPTCGIEPPVARLHRDLVVQRICAPSPAVAMLRRRYPPLEELLMDEEVASFTSVSVAAAPGFLPLRPRCGNPLASTLTSKEAFTFVPIGFNPSPGGFPPRSSPLQER
ncbi:uncharacterized protein troap isoform X4 [Gasterosteus aculeatus]